MLQPQPLQQPRSPQLCLILPMLDHSHPTFMDSQRRMQIIVALTMAIFDCINSIFIIEARHSRRRSIPLVRYHFTTA